MLLRTCGGVAWGKQKGAENDQDAFCGRASCSRSRRRPSPNPRVTRARAGAVWRLAGRSAWRRTPSRASGRRRVARRGFGQGLRWNRPGPERSAPAPEGRASGATNASAAIYGRPGANPGGFVCRRTDANFGPASAHAALALAAVLLTLRPDRRRQAARGRHDRRRCKVGPVPTLPAGPGASGPPPGPSVRC